MPRIICKKFLYTTFILVFLPLFVRAQVFINEVQLSPTAERFIELYNTGSAVVDLTDWFIQRKTATGSSFGSLVSKTNFQDKTIGAHDYFLISKVSLGNSDIVLDTLTLTESNTIQIKKGEDILDKVGWGEAGDCSNPCPSNPPSGQSIQRVASGWILAAPTPRVVNSSESALNSGEEENTNATTTATSNATTTQNSSGSASVHYNPVVLSFKKPETKIVLSAGRDRLGSVGAPMQFKADANFTYTRNSAFKWNFGDGSEGYGEDVIHTYDYAGDYVVVLNASVPNGQAVSRTNVKIIEPDLKVVRADSEMIELKNSSKYEVSLFGRVMIAQGNTFIFPQDTLIGAGQSTTFSSRVTGLHPNSANDVSLLAIGDTEPAKLRQKIEEKKTERVAQLEKELAILESRLVLAYQSYQAPIPPLGQDNILPNPTMADSTTETAVALNAAKVSAGGDWFGVLKRFFFKIK